MIHLEGMGLVGSFVASWLAAHGREFTWHDTDEPRGAWRACTGLAYPSGHKVDNHQLARWTGLANGLMPVGTGLTVAAGYRAFREHVMPHAQLGTWCFYSAKAPHNGRARVLGTVGGVKVSDATTFHLNAQTFVQATRERFAAQRREHLSPLEHAQTIVTHGFDPATLGAWSWGWSAQVHLQLQPEFAELAKYRPCFYMRDGYVLDYAYPVPGQRHVWYAGTSLITQEHPHSLPLQPKFDVWKKRMERKFQSAVLIGPVREGTLMEAWRPIPQDDLPLLSKTPSGTILIRPQYGSAIRHWWLVADALTEELGL